MHLKKNTIWLLSCLLAMVTLSACDNMRDGNRYKPYEETPFFENNSTARNLIDGTVPRGFLREDNHLYRGKTEDGSFAKDFPFPITAASLERGRDRYNIYCLVCHGVTGAGDGMVVRRGYKKPLPFSHANVKARTPGSIFDVITNGYNVMAGFKSELSPEDRWNVAAYVQTLGRIDTSSEKKTA